MLSLLRGADVDMLTLPIHKHVFPPNTGKEWASRGFNVIYSPLKGCDFYIRYGFPSVVFWSACLWNDSYNEEADHLPLLNNWWSFPLADGKGLLIRPWPNFILGNCILSTWNVPISSIGLGSEASFSVLTAWCAVRGWEQLVHSGPEVDAFRWQVQRFSLAKYKF